LHLSPWKYGKLDLMAPTLPYHLNKKRETAEQQYQ
jgi:hypothetical protein